MPTTSSCPDQARLASLRDGDLPESEHSTLIRHLDECPRCQAAMAELGGGASWPDMAEKLRQDTGAEGLEPGLERVLDDIAEQTRTQQHDGTPSDSRTAEAADQEWQQCLTPSNRPGAVGRLGHYDVLALVGRGGMGIVLKAFDDKLQRIVAIKILAPHSPTIRHGSQALRPRGPIGRGRARPACGEHLSKSTQRAPCRSWSWSSLAAFRLRIGSKQAGPWT